ncbi:TRAP transporter small permease protein [Brucella endophytica]|uniref:TRAP transporter small permease protein n=1 Tax=Brucella endophytica TaxID=1963359 RepID=A0A916ST43_9HYPH|nr:TRAP transporter small permease [Brucella endophytica]GGB12055.1 TRAP transporter small permease protein [Brucella endophytica]
MLKAYVQAVGNVSRGLAIVATLLIITAMLVVCQMVMTRYVFRSPTIWQTDFVVFSATAAMFLGAPYVLLKGGHIGVDAVEMMVGARTRSVLRVVGSVLGLLFCIIMLAATWIQFHDAWAGNWKHSSVWGPPLWVPLAALPVSFAMLCLQYVAQILTLLTVPAVTATISHGGVEPGSSFGADSRPREIIQ